MTVSQDVGQKSPEEALAYQRRWFALLILSMSLMLIVIDSTIVNIAFPSIRKTFGASFADAEWVNSIYSLVFGAALITWGKLGDQYGRRNIFIAGAALFGFSSLGVGLAPSIEAMILFRALQGMGGAMMSPSTLSIVSATFKGKERGIAFGIWGATAGVSAAVGPILGGWLIANGAALGVGADSWRLAFLINLPVVAIAIAGSFMAIRESRDKTASHQIDFVGIVLASLALLSFVFAAIEGQTYGWLAAKKVFTLGPITYPALADGVTQIPDATLSFIPFVAVFGAIMFVLFIVWELRMERRGGEPLFEFGMLKYRSFRYGLLTVLVVALGEFGTFLVLSIYLQLAKGLGAFDTGVQFLSFAGVTIVVAPMAGILSGKIGAKWVVTAGMVCEAVSLFWLSRTVAYDTPLSDLTPILMLYGAGIALAIAQLANIVLSDIPSHKAGVASGATNTLRQLGASLGIAILGAVLFGNFAAEASPLIRASTAFEDFSTRVSANESISFPAKAIGSQFGRFADVSKNGIIAGLEANEGFDSDTDALDQALANMPTIAKIALQGQGVNLDDPATVEQIRTDLTPDLKILSGEIQQALGTGFSIAARSAILLASIFVGLGALCSLLIPNTKAPAGDGSEAVAAH